MDNLFAYSEMSRIEIIFFSQCNAVLTSPIHVVHCLTHDSSSFIWQTNNCDHVFEACYLFNCIKATNLHTLKKNQILWIVFNRLLNLSKPMKDYYGSCQYFTKIQSHLYSIWNIELNENIFWQTINLFSLWRSKETFSYTWKWYLGKTRAKTSRFKW